MALELFLDLSKLVIDEIALVAHIKAQFFEIPGVLLHQGHFRVGLLELFLVFDTIAEQLLESPL